MLSICIPIYNFDVRPLVKELTKQIKDEQLIAEIILIDDASDLEYQNINNNTCQQHNYTILQDNVGRSKIRNLFPAKAQYNYLLFLDCDVQINDSQFLSKYINSLHNKPDVICGGRKYSKVKPSTDYQLNWKYGIKVESRSAKQRQKIPHKSFMTNNFIIRKQILSIIGFDENINGYGHEDTLFGIELQNNNFTISHIENPVLNGGLDKNSDFLLKTEQALKNLAYIEKKAKNKSLIRNKISLLKIHHLLERLKIDGLFFILFSHTKEKIRKSLTKPPISIFALNIYKLGFFNNLKHKKNEL